MSGGYCFAGGKNEEKKHYLGKWVKGKKKTLADVEIACVTNFRCKGFHFVNGDYILLNKIDNQGQRHPDTTAPHACFKNVKKNVIKSI